MRQVSDLRWSRLAFSALCILAAVSATLAGGFYLSVEKPASSGDSQAKNAAFLVRTSGCHHPENASVSATAEGLVKGQRQSVKLQLKPTSKGVYAIERQWPAEGVWLVAVRGSYLGGYSSVLVELGRNGALNIEKDALGKELNSKTLARQLTADDIEASLQELAKKWLPASQQASK
ncbi:MAG: hypothetical protein L0387_26055 [Acidobacteria bacterium]|nr:hypothetical protein [Acidobacteriota bacterium]MCI0625065.1 hypothetical protein [Acidobacteriota bacterium]MCI0718464.1 hypothetical protein [Acidobacteriota bacterium]